MGHKFKITSAKGGQFAAKFVYNSEVMLWSENYTGKAGAENCIASLRKHAPGAPVVDTTKGEAGKGYRFELAGSKDGQTFVRFVASNGETMVRSETYKSRASARNCIASLQKRAAAAALVDES
ncbi:YegP family protein [Devosia sp.]|uniref:YegP family protein n=1 Tax=Devosia sp. TaxID=1871048 RepID=UPI0037513C04